MSFELEQPIPNNRDNFFQFGHTAWDRKERIEREMPDWPKSLKGMSPAAKRNLNTQRKEWLETLHPIWTPSMEEAHDDIEQLLTWRGSASPECFGLRGEPFVGKTQIIQRFVDTFHLSLIHISEPTRPY